MSTRVRIAWAQVQKPVLNQRERQKKSQINDLKCILTLVFLRTCELLDITK